MLNRMQMLAILGMLMITSSSVDAQLTPTRSISGTIEPVSRLEEQLINGLRATRQEQQQFLRTVVTLSEQNKLDRGLINAIYVWSRRRQPLYPFPFFERGLRIEAQKRGVTLPPVALIVRAGGLYDPSPLPR